MTRVGLWTLVSGSIVEVAISPAPVSLQLLTPAIRPPQPHLATALQRIQQGFSGD